MNANHIWFTSIQSIIIKNYASISRILLYTFKYTEKFNIQSCIKFITQKLIFNFCIFFLYILPVHWVNRWEEKKIFFIDDFYGVNRNIFAWALTNIYIYLCILDVIYLQWTVWRIKVAVWVFFVYNVVQRRFDMFFHYRIIGAFLVCRHKSHY